MSRRAEVWTQPDSGSFVKRIADLPWERVGFSRELNRVSSGQITVPSIYRRIDQIVNPATDAGSLIRLFEGSENVASFYAKDADFDEDVQGTVTISGPGIENALEGGIIYPWDWTPGATETLFPDWVYGLGTNEITDPGFEDDPYSPLRNGDGEDGSTSGWSSFGTDLESFEIINNTGDAYEGDYYFKLNAGKYHSGMRQSLKVYPGKRNQFTARLKEEAALGKRFTMGVDVEDGYTKHPVNPFFYSDTVMVELGNVASNGNGTPGGSSDGTWQLMELDITWGDDQEDTNLFIQFDHHKESDGPEFWVDDVTMAGFGVGVGEWEPTHLDDTIIFEGSTEEAYAGVRSLKVRIDDNTQGYAGIRQPVVFEEGAPYYAEVWVRSPTAIDMSLSARQEDESVVIASESTTLIANQWMPLSLEFVPPDGVQLGKIVLLADEATACTFYADDFEVRTGLAAHSAGYILKEQLDEITTRDGASSALTWLKYDGFSDVLDNNSVPWAEDLKVRVSRGQTVRQLLDQLGGWGYEWEIIWNDAETTYELRFYQKYNLIAGGAGSNNDIKLTKGKSFRQGRVNLRDPGPNTFLGEGLEGALFEKKDSALEAAYGRIEGYVTRRDTQDGSTLESVLDNAIVEANNQRYGVKATLFERPLPVQDFDLGSKILVDIPPQLPNDEYRVVGFTGAWTVKDNHSSYTLDFSSLVYEAPFGGTTSTVTSDALNYLLGKFEPLPDVDRSKYEIAADEVLIKESVPTVMLAASNARQQVKNHADIVCGGADDEEAVQVALDTIQSEGSGIGRLQLSEGQFILGSAAVIDVPWGVSIVGVGRNQSQFIYPTSSLPTFVLAGENDLENFTIEEEPGT